MAEAQAKIPSKRRIYSPGWLNGILAGGVLTFILGFYLPATDANEAHRERLTELSESHARLTSLHRTTADELSKVEKIGKEQKSKLSNIATAEASATQALTSLKQHITEKLAPQIKAKMISVEVGAEAVSINIEGMYLIYPHQVFVHARGERLLCQVAQAMKKGSHRPTEVVAHANGSKPASRTLDKQFPTSWQLSGVLAADVAEKLQKCGVAGTDLRAVGAAHHKGNDTLSKKSPARFELLVYPPARK